MNILNVIKIIMILILLWIIFNSSREGMKCVINYKYLHYPLNEKLKIRKYNGEIDCNNAEFSDFCRCYK
jgi:hypothetical protein